MRLPVRSALLLSLSTLGGCALAGGPRVDLGPAVTGVRADPVAPRLQGKTDVLLLFNGDRLTCEIKELEHGLLRVKTDSMSTIEVEWKDIRRIRSRVPYRVELGDGSILYGSLDFVGEEGKVGVRDAVGLTEVPLGRIVALTRAEETIKSKLDFSVQLGFSFTKSSDVAQLNFGLDSTWRDLDWDIRFKLSSITTSKGNDGTSKKEDVSLGYRRFYEGGLFLDVSGGFQANDELGLKLRSYVGPGVGLALLRDSTHALLVGVGVHASREQATAGGEDVDQVEAVAGASYSIFDFESPKTDLTLQVAAFPSLTEAERIRGEVDARLRKEIVTDFFWDLTFYWLYDSSPPSSASGKDDYGIVSSLGWSF
ncbi:MAG: DUF481 domain-containing protein [Planctomycetota bacterium]